MAQVTPYNSRSKSKREQVEKMFNHIAPKYDFLNHFLSFGVDKSWRKTAVSMISNDKPKMILDIATGTADFAIALVRLHPTKITGIDISEKMLMIGHEKLRQKNLETKIQLMKADSEALPFEDGVYDAVTVAFGVRNFEHLEKGLSEIYRVLKPKGHVVILEFSLPKNFIIRALYKIYSKTILPLSGRFIANDKAAYTYLPASINQFPSGYKFLAELERAGFKENIFKPLTFGIATVYKGTKK